MVDRARSDGACSVVTRTGAPASFLQESFVSIVHGMWQQRRHETKPKRFYPGAAFREPRRGWRPRWCRAYLFSRSFLLAVLLSILGAKWTLAAASSPLVRDQAAPLRQRHRQIGEKRRPARFHPTPRFAQPAMPRSYDDSKTTAKRGRTQRAGRVAAVVVWGGDEGWTLGTGSARTAADEPAQTGTCWSIQKLCRGSDAPRCKPGRARKRAGLSSWRQRVRVCGRRGVQGRAPLCILTFTRLYMLLTSASKAREWRARRNAVAATIHQRRR